MKIAIAGYGVEGEANYSYFSRLPDADITIVDESDAPKLPIPAGAHTILGPGSLRNLDGFDLVIRTAGLSPEKIHTNGKIWSATNEFFEKCPAKIIGVTGTKGKGTTSSMIAEILKAAGKKVWLLGNIGVASLSKIDEINPDDIVVYELSSFQLWDLKRSPQIAVVLPIEAEHLDVHKDFDDYINAKSNIRRHQGADDVCIYYYDNAETRRVAQSGSEGTMIRYGIGDDGGAYVADDQFMIDGDVVCPTTILQVVGSHNIQNASAAITVAKQFGIDNGSIQNGLSGFKGLPHRIEYVRTLDGVDYYNDSFSSNPSSTLAAINSFEKPEILIMGGVDRGADFEHFVDEVSRLDKIKQVILIGEIRFKLGKLMSDKGVQFEVKELDAKTMSEIVASAKELASPGDVVLLSPGCASFDLFKDFYDRGDQFRNEVKAL